MTKLETKKVKEFSSLVSGKLSGPEIASLLETLVEKITEQILTDPETLEALQAVLPVKAAPESTAKKTSSAKRKKEPALFNPFEVAGEGEGVLKEKLSALEVSQLKDIIRDYDLDPYKKVSSCRKAEKFIGHILDTVADRMKAGSGYKGSL